MSEEKEIILTIKDFDNPFERDKFFNLSKEILIDLLIKHLKSERKLIIVLDKIKETINYYAVEDEDYSKIYNQEEQEIMKLLEEIE